MLSLDISRLHTLKPKLAKKTTYVYGNVARCAANHRARGYGWNVTRCLTEAINLSSASSTAARGVSPLRYNYVS